MVDTSSSYYNYRMSAGSLAVYQLLKRNKLPDENVRFKLKDSVILS